MKKNIFIIGLFLASFVLFANEMPEYKANYDSCLFKSSISKPIENRVLITEQNNQRLKNTDHQFVLEVKVTSITNEKIKLLWYVNSLWDYDSYKENSNNVTELPINSEKGYILKIPDGLS